MKYILTSVLLVLSIVLSNSQYSHASLTPPKTVGDDGDVVAERLLWRLASMTDDVISLVKEMVGFNIWGEGSRGEYDKMVSDARLMNNESCAECIALVGLLESLIQGGADYEELKNVTMAICYLIVPVEGWNPDTLCELALDTYAPHVIYIFNTTDKNAREACEFYQVCEFDSEHNPGQGTTVYDKVVKKSHLTSPVKNKNVNSELVEPRRDLKILHITDIHSDAEYDIGAPTMCDMPLCCRSEFNGNGSAMYWGDYECNIPHRTVDHIFYYVMADLRPDVILYTGDTVQHTIWDQPEDETIAIDKWLTDTLWFYFPGIPVFYSAGNHDMAPTNLYYLPRDHIQELNREYFSHWSRLSKFTMTEQETFEKGLYYTSVPFPGLRILSYNSNFAPLDNFYTLLSFYEQDYFDMLQWMEDTLALARDNSEKVIMLGHHPSGSSSRVPGYDEFITDLQARYSDLVILHLLGHNHNDKFSIVRDETTDEARGVQFSSPSLTSYTDINPSMRVFTLESGTFRPLDMVTYRLDIAADGDSSNPPIKYSYSVVSDYGMADATPASFEEFVNRLETDEALMSEFRYNMETQTGMEGDCDQECQADLLCELRHADYIGRSACKNSIPPTI